MMPLTFFCLTFNEESRISNVLAHATQWADSVVIVDKSSTDRTREICEQFPGVKVVTVPFSAAGHDDMVTYLGYVTTDWVFLGTCSEVPTKKLIEETKTLIQQRSDQLDVILIPRKMYSMGVHDDDSPWNITYYPFCINKNTAKVSNIIHGNYAPRSSDRQASVPYAADVCVYHLTHVTAKRYLGTMTDYFEAEAEGCTDPDGAIADAFAEIAKWEKRMRRRGPDLLGQYCAFPLYYLGKALFIWEKYRAVDVPEYYRQIRNHVLFSEWGVGTPVSAPESPQEAWRFQGKVQLGKVVRVPAWKKAWNKVVRLVRKAFR